MRRAAGEGSGCAPSKRYAGVLTLRTPEWNLIWKQRQGRRNEFRQDEVIQEIGRVLNLTGLVSLQEAEKTQGDRL